MARELADLVAEPKSQARDRWIREHMQAFAQEVESALEGTGLTCYSISLTPTQLLLKVGQDGDTLQSVATSELQSLGVARAVQRAVRQWQSQRARHSEGRPQ